MKRHSGLFILSEEAGSLIYGAEELSAIGSRVELIAPLQTKQTIQAFPSLLSRCEVIFSGWGGPLLNAEFLERAPNLRAFFYGAGSLASIVTEAVWKRQPPIVVTTAASMNAVPVAEYTLATILFSLKHGWRLSRETHKQKSFVADNRNAAPGCYRSKVGLICLGSIGRTLLEKLRQFELDIFVYDPFIEPAEANDYGVACVSLAEMFRRCDVVSLHAPEIAETHGMITGKLLESMKAGATFINTARPLIVRQDEMIEVAARRSDLQFVLDVTTPEPLPPNSPLYQLDNVLLTPHIAGSVGAECRRMGQFMVAELERYLAGEPLRGAVNEAMVWNSAHRPFHSADPRNDKQKPKLEILTRRKKRAKSVRA